MIIATNSYLDMGAFTIPLLKDSHFYSLHHLDLSTGDTSGAPETAFPIISDCNLKPETVLAGHASFATGATSTPTSVPSIIGHRRLGHPNGR